MVHLFVDSMNHGNLAALIFLSKEIGSAYQK